MSSMAVWGGTIHAQNYEHGNLLEVGFPVAKVDDPGGDEACGATVNGVSRRIPRSYDDSIQSVFSDGLKLYVAEKAWVHGVLQT
jgi:hypothetical protein